MAMTRMLVVIAMLLLAFEGASEKANSLTATFKPGKIGLSVDSATGRVTKMKPDSQGQRAGVKIGMILKALDGQDYSGSLLVEKAQGGDDYEVRFEAAAAKKAAADKEDAAAKKATADKAAAAKKAAGDKEDAAAKKATADKAAAAKKAAADEEDAAAKKATADKARTLFVIFKPGTLGLRFDANTGRVIHVTPDSQGQRNGVEIGMVIKAIDGQAFSNSLLVEKSKGGEDYKVRLGAVDKEAAAAKKLADEAAAQKADADKAAAEKADADKAAAVEADKAKAAVAAVKAAHEAAVAQKAAAADQAAAAAAAAAAKKAAAEKSAAEKPAAPVTRHLVLAVADVGAFMADPSETMALTKAIAGSLGVTTGQVQDVRITQAAAPTLSGTRLRRLMAGSVDVAFTCVNCQQGSCTETGLVSTLNAVGAQEVTSATCLPEEPNPCARVISTITTTPAPVQAPCTTVAPVVVSADPCAAQAKKFSQNAGGAKPSPIATWSPSMLWLALPSLLGMIFLVRGVSTARCGVPEPCRGEEARSLSTLLEEVTLSDTEPTEFRGDEVVEFLE